MIELLTFASSDCCEFNRIKDEAEEANVFNKIVCLTEKDLPLDYQQLLINRMNIHI